MWQTIDSAPKDGTRVLLFIPSVGPKVSFGYYINYETFSYGVSVNVERGWNVVGQTVGTVEPTHWMLVPADPE